MNVATYAAFKNELEKIAYHSVVDIAGLGILAAPTVQKMRGKEMSEKGTHAAELGGLGVLAGSSAHKIGTEAVKHYKANPGSTIWKAIREGAKHASAEPGLADGVLGLFKNAKLDLWNPAVPPAAAAPKPHFTMDMLQAAKKKLPAVARPRVGAVGGSVLRAVAR